MEYTDEFCAFYENIVAWLLIHEWVSRNMKNTVDNTWDHKGESEHHVGNFGNAYA